MGLLASIRNRRSGAGKPRPPPQSSTHVQQPMPYSPATVGPTTYNAPTNLTPIEQENRRLLQLTQSMEEERMREQALVNQIVEAAYRERYGDQWHLHLQNQHLTPLEIRRKPVPSSQSTSRDTSPGASSHYSGTTMDEHAEGSQLNTPSPNSSRSGSQSPHRSEHEGSSGQADPSTTFVDGSNHSHVVNAGNNMHPYAAVWPISYDPPPYTAHRPLSVISEEGTGQTAVQTAARRALLLAAQKQVVPVVVNKKKKKLKYEPAPLNHLTRGTMRKKVMGTSK
ncbi:uncharacterized protein CCOS01_04272 [Colletotrichum costaricense]|uniref:Uncharacterized protein n=1 Tax=Colletotrichum costaricense TaxID=1209916 RepID=A0AAI9Z2G2_9PEZI|nr:uncharacterized protein CCOS01_04272 [Colletotrichum costaricense]KAK1532289.1 hypothetical protein CCOS01_04272 [Colletotrichum costaricense]